MVQLKLPGDLADVGRAGRRDLAGTGDFSPALDDETSARVLFWLRAFRTDASSLPRVKLVIVNAAEACQERSARPEFSARVTGSPAASTRSRIRRCCPPVSSSRWRRPAAGLLGPRSRISTQAVPTRGTSASTLKPALCASATGARRRRRSANAFARCRIATAAARRATCLRGDQQDLVGGLKVANPLAAIGGAEQETIEAALERIR